MDNFFERPPKRHIKELNLVPIIDMFTTVVFFLLLSTTFVALAKLTLPPSKVSIVTQKLDKIPIAAKIFLIFHQNQDKLLLTWSGRVPGQKVQDIASKDFEDNAKVFIEKTKNLLADLKAKYPEEKSIQIGLESRFSYQKLISLMDGVREIFPEVVLISYLEAEAMRKSAL